MAELCAEPWCCLRALLCSWAGERQIWTSPNSAHNHQQQCAKWKNCNYLNYTRINQIIGPDLLSSLDSLCPRWSLKMEFFLDFKSGLKFLNFQHKNQPLWEFSSEKKEYLAQSGDFVHGWRYQTNQFHSWLGHEDKGQESQTLKELSI